MDSDVELDLELERKVDKATQSNSPTPSKRGTLSPTFNSSKLVESKEYADDNTVTDKKELEELLSVVQSENEHGEQHGHEQAQAQAQRQGQGQQQQSESRTATPGVDESTQKKVEEIDNGAAVNAAAAVANEQKQSKNNKKKKDK